MSNQSTSESRDHLYSSVAPSYDCTTIRWNSDPLYIFQTKVVENTRYPLMKRHISSHFFPNLMIFCNLSSTSLCDFQVTKNCVIYWYCAQWGKLLSEVPVHFMRFNFLFLENTRWYVPNICDMCASSFGKLHSNLYS